MARNKKAKEYASLAAHVADAAPAEVLPAGSPDVPPLEPWVEGDLKLKQLAQRIEVDYMEFVTLARQAMAENWHQKFGFVDPSAYFEQRVGLSYRTLRRRLSILEAIERLPEGEQPAAKEALSALGGHKASILAPLLGKDPEWQKAAEFAKDVPEAAVQSMVSEKLGHAHRGLAASQHPGARFFDYILNTVPPDERERTDFVFRKLMGLAGSTNAMAVFLVLVGLGEQELAAHGITRD